MSKAESGSETDLDQCACLKTYMSWILNSNRLGWSLMSDLSYLHIEGLVSLTALCKAESEREILINVVQSAAQTPMSRIFCSRPGLVTARVCSSMPEADPVEKIFSQNSMLSGDVCTQNCL